MALSQLFLKHFRNLEEQTIDPSPGLNLIYGDNGSGKSSLLEAIYLLGRGRSFRTHLLKQVVSTNQPALIAVGKFFIDHQQTTIGFSYDRLNKATIRVDQRNVSLSSELASLFPLLFIGSNTGRLLSLGERQRRRCLDWGVFHVEPLFLNEWRRYSRSLKQRNVCLQAAAKDQLPIWDKELAQAGEAITQMRQHYVDLLRPIFISYVTKLLGANIQLTRLAFEPGWSKSASSLLDYLSDNQARDIAMGYTQRGPHRADLKIDIEHGALSQYGSGGQQKLVTCALLLSQVALFRQLTAKVCTILVDDLPAELDSQLRKNFLNLLLELDTQLFISATELSLIDVDQQQNKKTFHVEHGLINEVPCS